MDRPVTLQTLADELGVSKQTVSNAFSRPDQLSSELRQRILDVARRKGYAGPDPSARALSRGETGVVGVVLTERSSDALADDAASEFLVGVAAALEQRCMNLLLISGRPGTAPDDTPVLSAAVDGFILYSISPEDPYVAAATARGLPVVVVDQPRRADWPCVGIDDRLAGRLVGDHLANLGHRRIGVLSLRLHWDSGGGLVTPERRAGSVFPLTLDRLAGIEDAGLDVAAVWECQDRAAVVPGVEHIVDRTDASAIVAMSDHFAIDAIEHLRSRDLAVPADVSIVGIDDIPASRAVGLTTVHQDHRHKGQAAVAALLDGAGSESLEARLVQRSTAAEVRTGERTRPPRRSRSR